MPVVSGQGHRGPVFGVGHRAAQSRTRQGDRRARLPRPAGHLDAQGLLHLRRRPDPRHARRRPVARGRVHLHLQLRRRHHQRRGQGAARHRQRGRRPRRAADRRHPRIGQDAEVHPRPDAVARRQERLDRGAARQAHAPADRRSTPIMSASTAPTISSSATAWTSPTPSANCPSSASSRATPERPAFPAGSTPPKAHLPGGRDYFRSSSRSR